MRDINQVTLSADIQRTSAGVERGNFSIAAAEHGGFIAYLDAYGIGNIPRPMVAGSLDDVLTWLRDRLQPVATDGAGEPTIRAA